MNKFDYRQLVRKGIELLEQMKTAKYDICILALQVCDIQHGGHTTDGRLYSIKKFADDIGMKSNTLNKWLEEHRNVVEKLPTKPKAEDYVIIRQVMRQVTNKTPKTIVNKIYEEVAKQTPEDRKLLRMIQDAKGIRNFTTDYSLKAFSQDDVSTLLEILQKTVTQIKQQKTKTKLRKGVDNNPTSVVR